MTINLTYKEYLNWIFIRIAIEQIKGEAQFLERLRLFFINLMMNWLSTSTYADFVHY